MSLAFLFKKTWHPSKLQNSERVWIAEQKDAAEKRRIEELTKQVKEEQQVRELEEMQAAGGHGPDRKQRIDWMYEGPMRSAQDQQAEANEYLLGKEFKMEDKGTTELKKLEETKAPGSLFTAEPTTSANEAFRRVQEDPLLRMRKARMEAEESVINNPVKMSRIRQQLETELAAKADKKRAKREAKKARKEEKKEKKREKREEAKRKHGRNDTDKNHAPGHNRHANDSTRQSAGLRRRADTPSRSPEARSMRNRDGPGYDRGDGRDRDRCRHGAYGDRESFHRRRDDGEAGRGVGGDNRGRYSGRHNDAGGVGRERADRRPGREDSRVGREDSRHGRDKKRSPETSRDRHELRRESRRRDRSASRSRSPEARTAKSGPKRSRSTGASPASERPTGPAPEEKRYGLIRSDAAGVRKGGSRAEGDSLGPAASLLEAKQKERSERERERAEARRRRTMTPEEKMRRLKEMEDDGTRNQELKKQRVEESMRADAREVGAGGARKPVQSATFLDKMRGEQVDAMSLQERMQRNRHYQQRGADAHNFMERS